MTHVESLTTAPNAQGSEKRSCQTDTHVFVIRFWLEAREIEGKQQIWRGVIEHVASRERRFLKKPEEVVSFLKQYQGEFEVQQSAVENSREYLKDWWSKIFRK